MYSKREEIERIELVTLPLDADICMRWSDLYLTEEYPEAQIPVDGSGLPDACLVDELGQSRQKEWGSKLHGVEKWMEWLPDREDPVYGAMYREQAGWPQGDVRRRTCTLFSFEQANLYRAFGEFHFGALDAGPTSTGLEGVAGQRDRGIAYRRYVEYVASHPHGVGCHYFQCYDQFVLGRFDGENYNIGLFDICSQPYPEMMQAVRACSAGIYEVAAGGKEPTQERARETAMIAF